MLELCILGMVNLALDPAAIFSPDSSPAAKSRLEAVISRFCSAKIVNSSPPICPS